MADKGTVVVMISSMMGYMLGPDPELDPLLIEPLKEDNFEKIVAACKEDSSLAYNMSKRGVHLLVEARATLFGEKRARLVSVSPGVIMTPMAREAAKAHPERMAYMEQLTPCKRSGEPEDIANAVEFLISEKASFITGCDLRVDGGLGLKLIGLEEI